MKTRFLCFAFGLAFFILAEYSYGMFAPLLPYEAVNSAYHKETGKDLPRSMAFLYQDGSSSTQRRMFSSKNTRTFYHHDDDDAVEELIESVENICGPSDKKISLSDIQETWYQIWWESRTPLTYDIKLYLLGNDSLPAFPIIQAVGQYNGTLYKDDKGRLAYIVNRTSTFFFPNGTQAPTTIQTGAFLFKQRCGKAEPELCGVDFELAGSGLYGNSMGISGGLPIYRNVLNTAGGITADSYNTAPVASGVGSDGGNGANYYVTLIDQVTQEVELKIYSTFNVIDPSTGDMVLWGFQLAKGTQSIPGLPI